MGMGMGGWNPGNVQEQEFLWHQVYHQKFHELLMSKSKHCFDGVFPQHIVTIPRSISHICDSCASFQPQTSKFSSFSNASASVLTSDMLLAL